MKNNNRHLLALLLALGLPFWLRAADPFTSGSTGAYGEMNITANTTLALPPDGIFHCTTINVASGATLRFNRNALNTPVYLLARATWRSTAPSMRREATTTAARPVAADREDSTGGLGASEAVVPLQPGAMARGPEAE